MTTHETASRRFQISLTFAMALVAFVLAGCQGPTDDSSETDETVGESELAMHGPHPKKKDKNNKNNKNNKKKVDKKAEAKRLYEKETFGGNGRTCLTCHSKNTGTINPEQVQDIHECDPDHPLFSHDGSDDFQGNGVSRILEDATFLVKIPLPPNVTLAEDPDATHVVLRRGVPSTINNPALDPVLMYDGRHTELEPQALSAIQGHAQNTIEPTEEELELIAEHQQTEKFFSSDALRDFADGGPAPKLPKGKTAAEKRGRYWFEDAPVPFAINQKTSRKGLCALCHSGPMLNESNGWNPVPVAPFPLTCTPPGGVTFPPGAPPGEPCGCNTPATQGLRVPKGTRFQSVLVSELNAAQNPVYTFLVQTPDGSTIALPSPDPGRALITGNFAPFPVPGGEFSTFKIPSVWDVKKTAPYFHDNSAKTLGELVEHYATFFAIATDCNIDGDPPLVMTAQDKADLIAYLKLL